MKENEVKQADQTEEKASEKKATFSDALKKAADIGKKAADGVQKGAKAVSEQTKQSLHEKKMKKYNPLFPKEFKSKNFKLPNVIKIVGSRTRKDIEVFEGAIGWTELVKDTEILFLYEEFVEKSCLKFFPHVQSNMVYCLDKFEKDFFVNAADIHNKAHDEKLAELKMIAHMLGAKRCAIEIVEEDDVMISRGVKLGGGFKKLLSTEQSASSMSKKSNKHSGRIEASFEGNSIPQRPELKWFANDRTILSLIEMRCTDSNSIKSETLELNGSSSATLSQDIACAIDKIVGVNLSMEATSIKEHSSKLLFEIEF